ncbi:uncharacterized protein LOC131148352 [Malania oleifera]|uniref:uncharacterized protein LOC131148352 n=1 Tax=Malania oleifera TaxID=397392 RepID=UPI0025ADB05F|nr:uncharacterized protein LOC131148352 [Malania oleifera]
MDEFNSCLDNCGLMEMSFGGRRFSWCNGHEGCSHSWARLDRAVMNMIFSNTFPNAHLEYLMRKLSDHSHMVINFDTVEMRYGASPFRFQNMWCSHDSFIDCVTKAWVELVYAQGLLKLATKLNKTKIALRAWNMQVFGRVDKNIKELEERLEVLENQLLCDSDPRIETEFFLTKLDLEIEEQKEETRLAQQAKKSWLKEGDQNSKLFHAVVKQRRKNSVISNMNLANGSVLNSPESIHLAVTSYFQNFLIETRTHKVADLSTILKKVITEEENELLCQDPLEEEVKTALFSIPKTVAQVLMVSTQLFIFLVGMWLKKIY